MSLILLAKRDLLKRLYNQPEGAESTAIDEWFDAWVFGYYGNATVLATDGNVYEDDSVYLESVRANLRRSLSGKLTGEIEAYEETTDIDRVKRLIRMTIFVIQRPDKMKGPKNPREP